MATYAIGDIHGCWYTLQGLLGRIRFRPGRDRLWLTGDLIHRGPHSRHVLNWAFDHQDCVHFVLGNHEMHLLAMALGVEGFGRPDALGRLLDAPEAAERVAWLRRQPLLLVKDGSALVHAGLLPRWTLEEARILAGRCSERLQGAAAGPLLEASWRRGHPAAPEGARPGRSSRAEGRQGTDGVPAEETLFLHAATLLRLVDRRGEMVEGFVKGEDEIPAGAVPWFDAPGRRWRGTKVIFGHWAMLGLMLREDAWCLDSGCVWGGELTAVRWEDRKVFQEARAPEDAPG